MRVHGKTLRIRGSFIWRQKGKFPTDRLGKGIRELGFRIPNCKGRSVGATYTHRASLPRALYARRFEEAYMFGLSSIVGNIFGEDTDVARLLTVEQSVAGITVPGPEGLSDFHLQGVKAPGLVSGSVAILFYRACGDEERDLPCPSSFSKRNHAADRARNLGLRRRFIVLAGDHSCWCAHSWR